MSDADKSFLELSVHYLREHYGPKILRCLEEMDEDQIWWRPNAESNSIGNLILHLCGNARQWIMSGVVREDDIRERQSEFDELGPVPTEILVHKLNLVLNDVCNAILHLEPSELLTKRTIQGNDVTVIEAIYHVVEHFSMHAGQIIYITKLHKGKDLAFYKITEDGDAFPQW